jgi:energy-coupling factor transport system permease protein
MKGLVIAFRFMDIIAGSGLFVFTTDPAELAYALMRSGIPYRYGFMLVIALRFIPVFQGEMSTVSNAQKARGLEIDKGGVNTLLRSIRYTFVPMIVSALSKADVLAVSMEGRAFGYREMRTFSRVRALKLMDKAIIAASVAITAILLINLWTGWLPLPKIKA